MDMIVPTTPPITARMMYSVPMSLWLVEKRKRRNPVGCPCAPSSAVVELAMVMFLECLVGVLAGETDH